MAARRRIHGETGRHLEQVVLDDIADGAGVVVEASAPNDAKVLGHGELHASTY
jgi:hypothetical protein